MPCSSLDEMDIGAATPLSNRRHSFGGGYRTVNGSGVGENPEKSHYGDPGNSHLRVVREG